MLNAWEATSGSGRICGAGVVFSETVQILFISEYVMSALQEAEKLLSQLSPGEKARLLQLVARELGGAFPGIESTSAVCGGDPCIIRTRIPVWTLERLRQLGSSEAEILRNYPTLNAEDLVNAWSYVSAHREEIERQIKENEEA